MGAVGGGLAPGLAAEHRAPRRRSQPAAPGRDRAGHLPCHRGRDGGRRAAQAAGARDGLGDGQGDEALLRRHPARPAIARREAGQPQRALGRWPGLPPARRELRLRDAAAQRVPLHRRLRGQQRLRHGRRAAATRARPRAGRPASGRRRRRQRTRHADTRRPGRARGLGARPGRRAADGAAAPPELAGQPPRRARPARDRRRGSRPSPATAWSCRRRCRRPGRTARPRPR